MLLTCRNLRIALVTTHLPLIDVPKAISRYRVTKVINTVIEEMVNKFGVKQPKITVCGLNPHAGEDGYLGNEEKKIIMPAINEFIEKGYVISGPVPADTAFREEQRKKTDVYICMYTINHLLAQILYVYDLSFVSSVRTNIPENRCKY